MWTLLLEMCRVLGWRHRSSQVVHLTFEVAQLDIKSQYCVVYQAEAGPDLKRKMWSEPN